MKTFREQHEDKLTQSLLLEKELPRLILYRVNETSAEPRFRSLLLIDAFDHQKAVEPYEGLYQLSGVRLIKTAGSGKAVPVQLIEIRKRAKARFARNFDINLISRPANNGKGRGISVRVEDSAGEAHGLS